MNRWLYLGIGFGIWLLATIIFRLAGHLFFLVDNTPLIIGLWLVTFIGLWGIVWLIFRWQQLEAHHVHEAAILLALPGMFGDAVAVQFFATVFPNMPLNTGAPFAAWLLWAYATVLLAGLWYRSTQN